jgi:hypothetical protein
MLARRIASAFSAALVCVVAGSLLLAAAAFADYVVCPTPTSCYIVVTDPGGGGGGSGRGGGGGDGGPLTGCTYARAEPQPPAGDPAWQGHAPGDGAVYVKTCKIAGGPLGIRYQTELIWSPTNPANTPTPAELAQQAIKDLPLRGPGIGISANLTPSGSGTVGLPVWLWTAVTDETWGPISRTATVPGLSVTATAKAQSIRWQMGDGNAITCHNPGTRYETRYGNSASPTCGYQYSAPSSTLGNPHGRFTIMATTAWRIDWAGGGDAGTLTVTRQSQSSVEIGEVVVLGQ